MGENTPIEWAHHTFNPWWGCVEVSPGCDHCYARTLAKRYGFPVWGPGADRRFFGDKHWKEPLKWNAKAKETDVRRRVFCASMADIFELHRIQSVNEAMNVSRRRAWDLVRDCSNLDWLLLTKRIENVTDMVPPDWLSGYSWPANAWLLVSAEDQPRADKRIHKLLILAGVERVSGAMRIIRVFPRRTKATPDDNLHLVALGEQIRRANVDVTFTYDKPRAEWLAEQWKRVAPVKIGGVAYGDPGADFVPGRYIKPGYIFTSRGCPRRCWFCSVWKRDPVPRLLPIIDGWNILDDNLLACPEHHVRSVFSMLARQDRRVEFTGGLEALALRDYQVELLAGLRPRPNCFFAYDPGDSFETLRSAASRLLQSGFTRQSHRLRDALEARNCQRRETLAGVGLAVISTTVGEASDYSHAEEITVGLARD